MRYLGARGYGELFYALTPQELAELQAHADRLASGRTGRRKSGRNWSGGRAEDGAEFSRCDASGLITEAVAARYLGLDFSFNYLPSGGDGGVDIETPEGELIQVKSTPYRPAHLAEEADKTITAHYYILARYGGGLTVELVGFATAEELKAAPIGALREGGQMNRIIHEADLKRMEQPRADGQVAV